MAILAPTQNRSKSEVQPQKSFAGTKRWISQLFYTQLNQHVESMNGDLITNGQKMVENIFRLATDEEGDPYVQLAAAKFITERMEGKAATMQEDVHEEMPRMVICVGDVTSKQIKKAIVDKEGAEPKEDICVEISDEDGSGRQEMILEAE